MILWQFEAVPRSGLALPVPEVDLFALLPLVWIAVAFLVLAGLLLGVRAWHLSRPHPRRKSFELKVLHVLLPKLRNEEEAQRVPTAEQIREAISVAETFFSAMGGLKAQRGIKTWLFGRTDEMAFEIVSHKKEIHFYLAVPSAWQGLIEQQLSAAYPDAYIEPVEDYNIFSPTGTILGSYLTFKRPQYFPIKSYRKLESDPLNAIANALSRVPENEGVAIQFVARSARGEWRKPGLTIARNMQQGVSLEDALKGKTKHQKSNPWLKAAGVGESKKPDDPSKDYRLSPLEDEAVKGLQEKASKAGLDVNIRVVVSAEDPIRAEGTLGAVLNAFSQYNIYQFGNAFAPAVPRSKDALVRRFIYRSFDERYKTVLNAEEMASVWHLPLPFTETPNIAWLAARRGPAPATVPVSAEQAQIELGYNLYRGAKTPVWMKAPDRQRHMYIMGKSGSGKSEFISSLVLQDIRRGAGVCVIDPHGDLIDKILSNIPRERVDDVIYFNPSDLDRPMGLNMLEARDESLKDFAVQEMIAIFYKLFGAEMIGPIFEHQMRNVMLTLMSDPENPGTIAEIPRMFSDEAFTKSWVEKVQDPVVRAFWEKEMAKTSDFHKSETLGYLISKVGRFVENEMMRNIIGQTHSSFDFRDVMDREQVLLVNLSKGKTGEVNAALLGLIIVTKLQMAALSRADMPESERKDFYLYIDEFQNFVTDSVATILSEARKYRLDLVMAHQYIAQLVKDNDTKVRDAVFGNVGTMFVSRVGPEDADFLKKIYEPDFEPYDLINSDKFTWYCKMIVDNTQQKPFTLNFNMPPYGSRELADAIKELSRLKYGRDRALVEAEIMERSQLGGTSALQGPLIGEGGF